MDRKLPTGITKTPHGRYRAAICYKGIRKAAIELTASEAERRLKELLASAQEEHLARQEAATVWTLQEAFDRARALRWNSAKSGEKLIANGLEALAFFGPGTLVTHITSDLIDEWAVELVEGHKNGDGTINRKLSALSVMLTMAKERGKLKELPAFPRRKERINRIVFFSPEEEEAILKVFAYFGREDHAEATIVLADTGFRPSELWELKAWNVDLRNKTISLWKTKNDQARTIPMTGRVRSIMAARCKKYPDSCLFPGSSNDWYSNAWEQVRAQLGRLDDPGFIPYAWRHTCCSRLVQRGVPLLHVKEWMGHKSIQTTMRYAHLAPGDLMALAKILEGGADARWHSTTQSQREETPPVDLETVLQ